MNPLYTTADDRTAGTACPACGDVLRPGDDAALCGSCGRPHHSGCWNAAGGCAAYACAPANRTQPRRGAGGGGGGGGDNDRIVITTDQINQAAPLPQAPAPRGVRVPTQEEIEAANRPKYSRGAIAAIITAVAGIPLFGLVTGPVAVVIGAISLGGISAGKRRGVWVASVAILLGLADFFGWAAVVYHFSSRGEMPGMMPSDFHVSESDLKDAPPVVAAALRANVLITRAGPLGGALGSGVVLSTTNGTALILTNRHVASPDSTEQGASVGVQYVDGRTVTGTVVWNAPEGVDASLVRAPISPSTVAIGLATVPSHIGDDVLAVGNPRGLGWTLTKGTVSQFRERNAGGGPALRIIQTSAPINPGNSGGGLYAADGKLIGVNTYSADKRESEGLGFAISLDSIKTLLPSWATDELAAAAKAAAAKADTAKPGDNPKDKPADKPLNP